VALGNLCTVGYTSRMSADPGSKRQARMNAPRAAKAAARALPPRPPAASARGSDAALAMCHQRARADRSAETAEDYVEQIAELIATAGEARVVDLARRIGVTHVTVVRTIERLQKAGLVSSKPYRAIFLTQAGKDLAERCRRRHEIVVQFLTALGISDAVAQADAEGIEHHVSEETLAAFERFSERSASPGKPASRIRQR